MSDAMRILLATDGSDPSRLGVELVANVAWPAGTEILVTEAVDHAVGLFGGPWPAVAIGQVDRIEADLLAAAGGTVLAVRERLASAGRSVQTEILRGRPASAIVERARTMAADLIVIGSRGHGTIDAMLLGSVSAEVVDHARTPVLVARGERISRVILAWDGSPGASRAADLLTAWPIFGGARIRVVSVADIGIPWWTGFPVDGSPQMLATVAEAADASRVVHDDLARTMTARLKDAGLAAEAERRSGDAAAQILAAAGDVSADLIVMGTHGRTGLARLLLGSVARNVLQHAACSVLVVRDPVLGGPPAPA